MRMSDWSEQSIAANALAAVSGNLLWTLIGDTTVSSAVAQIEHTFTASAYLESHSIFSDLASASATLINVTLRNSGGAIVTCTHDGAVGINHIAAATGINRFYCGIIAATKYYNAEFSSVVENSSPGTGTQAPAQAVGSNATAADRVRVAFNSGNITAGRVTTYGLKA